MSRLFLARDWRLEETPEGAEISVTSPFLWPLTLFFGVWLTGWTAGEVSAGREAWRLISGGSGGWELLPAAFLLFWLAGWTAGGVFAWGVFLFSIKGCEKVTLREGTLCIRPETFLGLGWTWKFPVGGMTPPKLVEMPLPAGRQQAVPPDGAPPPRYAHIAIESGGRKWRLGLGLTEARAKDLLHTLNSRFGLPRERR